MCIPVWLYCCDGMDLLLITITICVAQAERRIEAILSTEKVAYSVLLQQESAMIAGFGHRDRDRDGETEQSASAEFETQTLPFLSPLTPSEWAITDTEMEILLKSKCVDM